jgi:hypothetical protein
MYPFNETVDATSTVVFYLKIRGTQCVKYNLYIYDVATNTQKYTSGVVTLDSTLFDGNQLNIDVDMSALGADSYYWKIDLYYDASNYITSHFYPFAASSPSACVFSPTVPSTVTTASKEFICAYTQAEGVTAKYWEMVIYDSTFDGATKPEDHIIATSGRVWSPNIRYTFNGLVSGQSYKIQCFGVDNHDVAFATELKSFNVSYITPVSLAHPTATPNDDTSVTLMWNNIVAIEGETSGTVSYEHNYLYAGNIGLNLAAEAYVRFTFDFSAPFTKHWVATLPNGFTGDLGEIKDTAGVNYIYFGYDGTKFYLNVNGNYYYDTPEAITTNPYIFAVIFDGISISMYNREVA